MESKNLTHMVGFHAEAIEDAVRHLGEILV
jgi:hypothetical protein